MVETYDKLARATGSYTDYGEFQSRSMIDGLGYHIIITRPDKEMLEVELPVLVKDWGGKRLIRHVLPCSDVLQAFHDLRVDDAAR